MEAAAATAKKLPARCRFPASATILLTGNAHIRQLNRDFRGIDRPTNVLSFPQYEPEEIIKQKNKKTIVEIGDIALAYQYVLSESKRDNKALLDHITHLVVHGLLHLYGYDHGSDDEAEKMERKEIDILKLINIENPYAAAGEKNK